MSSSKLFSILAIVAVVCFVTLITLQFVELSFYDASPSVWPASQ